VRKVSTNSTVPEGEFMPKTVKISLKKIVQQIDVVTKELKAVKKRAINPKVKQDLDASIKSLEKVKHQVKEECKTTYNVTAEVK
jgi:hypothetical protein